MQALIIKGTTWSGKVINKGEVHEMPEDVFRLFKLAGQAIEAPAPEPETKPEPAPVVTEPAPAKPIKRKR